jgi:hypothetical protein
MTRFNVARTPPFDISHGTITAKPVCHRWHRQIGTSYSFYIFHSCFLLNFYKKERFTCTTCTTCI